MPSGERSPQLRAAAAAPASRTKPKRRVAFMNWSSSFPTGAPGEWREMPPPSRPRPLPRSEEHTSELQSRLHLVCRLLLEKKKQERNHSRLTSTWTFADDAKTLKRARDGDAHPVSPA